MEDIKLTISLEQLLHRNDEQADQIIEVLKKIKPTQCSLLGTKTVRSIAKGSEFEMIEGGRHLNPTDIIAILSLIATVSQLSIFAFIELKKLFNASSDQLKVEAKKIIINKLFEHPELEDIAELISNEPEILEQILNVVTERINNLPK